MAQDDIQGQVVDAQGNPVSGAIVELTRSFESNPVEEQTVLRTTTDSNGNYIFESHPDGDGTTQDYHVSCYNHDGTAYVNSFNNPGVTADLSPAIPDSEIYQDVEEGDGTTTFSSDSDSWSFSLDSPDSPDDTELMAGFESAISFSDTDTMKVDWELASGGSTAANFGADVTQSYITDSKIDAGDCEYSLQKKSTGGFSRQTDSISVGGDPNDLFVGVGSQLSTSLNRSSTLTVYEIYGEDSQGNEVWNMNIPSNL